MKYGIWFVRLIFAAWLIPAGINHFMSIFPQPMGSQPLSQELISALLDSSLFDLVKAVELIAGLGLLFGIYTPLALLLCMPVSFCVFYWDAPLEGWSSIAAIYGYAILSCNVILCLAFFKSYRSMFALRVESNRKQLVLAGRLFFGFWMLINGANYLFLSLWPGFSGQEPLAIQLMTALVNSRLLDVAMTIQLFAGALILAGVLVPVALCILMPISSCALYWAVVLDHQPLYALLAIIAFALNGLLMLAYLPYYQDTLQKRALAFGEASELHMNFNALYTNPKGQIARAQFIPGMIVVLAAIAFFNYVVTGLTAQFCILILLYPAFVLLSQRIQDIGYSTWLASLPFALMIAKMAILLSYINLGEFFNNSISWLAIFVSVVFVIWGSISHQRQQT